jgi:hypothetical protein
VTSEKEKEVEKEIAGLLENSNIDVGSLNGKKQAFSWH